MERSLLWGVLALGALGWLAGCLLTWGSGGDRARRGVIVFALVAIVGLVAVATLTLGPRPLWTDGQPWGRGVLLGGVAALLAAWIMLAGEPEDATSPHALRRAGRAAAPLLAGLVPTAATFLWFGPTAVDASVGVATGWFMVSLLLAAGVSASAEAAGDDPQAPHARGVRRHAVRDRGIGTVP
jgi:hypothetical protein